MASQHFQTVYCNVACGGRVVRVGAVHSWKQDAVDEARRRNERAGREYRNVKWTVREVDEKGRAIR